LSVTVVQNPGAEEWANLRRQWFGSVYEIASLEFQRRTWLAPPNPSRHCSYVEFCCSYPQSDQLRFAFDRGHLSTAEFDLLANLGEAIARHVPPQGDYDHRAILDDPNWHAIVEQAERVRQELLVWTRNPSELSHLTGKAA
jgi:hypothetical protein